MEKEEKRRGIYRSNSTRSNIDRVGAEECYIVERNCEVERRIESEDPPNHLYPRCYFVSVKLQKRRVKAEGQS